MIFLSCQPNDVYFQWQIEVQITNFRKFNISDKMHILVWYKKETENIKRDNKTGKEVKRFLTTTDLEPWKKIQKKYPEVKIFFYEDEGVDLWLYIPQLRPHTIKKHFKAHPELEKEVIFYHDSDIIFNYLPDFQQLVGDDVNWQSNTSHYLDYDYLLRKEKQGNIPEHEAIGKLAEIGRITVDTIQSYTGKTGGAQYLLKNVDSDFWADVERICLEIRKAFSYSVPGSINKRYFPNEATGYQSWCADMWAVNFALWSRGKVTDVTPQLDFSWATDTAKTFLEKPIFHNAGATATTHGLFYKNKWIDKSPLGLAHPVKKDSASFYYVQAMAEVAK